eukprot:CAMPEP_0194363866 /NCGR_PEP_ID=MMETSP0174-20130528/11727_1 /TAXON_ID=216777 /ORGANISM="Proboscia alata, Strain PI-D3" /LENGTH=677 /DNA_ID=CAMNT_0039137573 /DNA_START=1 /DNA_END=2034 /DNA_ORIENTATION=-
MRFRPVATKSSKFSTTTHDDVKDVDNSRASNLLLSKNNNGSSSEITTMLKVPNTITVNEITIQREKSSKNKNDKNKIYQRQDLKSLKDTFAAAKKGKHRVRIRVSSPSPKKVKINRKPLGVLCTKSSRNSSDFQEELRGGHLFQLKNRQQKQQQEKSNATKRSRRIDSKSPRKLKGTKKNRRNICKESGQESQPTTDLSWSQVSSTVTTTTVSSRVTPDNKKRKKIRCKFIEETGGDNDLVDSPPGNSLCSDSQPTTDQKKLQHEFDKETTADKKYGQIEKLSKSRLVRKAGNASSIKKTGLQEEVSGDKHSSPVHPQSIKYLPPRPYVFEHPSPDIIPFPDPIIVKSIHDIAAQKSNSHQFYLTRITGCKLLSLEDVVIPSICHVENEILRTRQSLAQQYAVAMISYNTSLQCPSSSDNQTSDIEHNSICSDKVSEKGPTITTILECRKLVRESGKKAVNAALNMRIQRETQKEKEMVEEKHRRKLERIERKKFKREERRREMEKTKTEKLQEKKSKNEMRHAECKKIFPKNKELWREIAIIMTELSKLEREKKAWDIISAKLKTEEEAFHNMEEQVLSDVSQSEVSVDFGEVGETCVEVESKVIDAVNDMSFSADRITRALQSISTLMENAEITRKELYEKYSNEHLFRGFTGMDEDPLSLLRQFTKETPESLKL